jgi:peroxiredoxin
MAPALAALPTDGAAERPLPLVVTTGDREENRRLVAEQKIACPVLLQEQMEVAALYQVHGTPMGYLIDEQGRIASELAAGAEALLALAGRTNDQRPKTIDGHRGNRSLADSKLARDGLPAGTPAPHFTLPALEGGELALEEFRGRRLLLVFSDPSCGPCDQLAPALEQFHRRTAAIRIVMVSRGDPDANRAKAAAHGITFPVLLQKQWEISRQYAMFATPIAYLIDAAGNTAADVAVGVAPILALLSSQAPLDDAGPDRRCGCGALLTECPCSERETARQR